LQNLGHTRLTVPAKLIGYAAVRGPASWGSNAITSIETTEFIALLGGSAVAWPLAARGQQASGRGGLASCWEFLRMIWKLNPAVAAFRKGLRDLGWIEGATSK